MLVFPQFATGSVGMYPLRRRRSARTVRNQMADGSEVKYTDPDWAVWEWELLATGLTESEWLALRSLHQAVQGRRGTFTFLEPAGNLLLQSEDPTAAEWNNDPQIGVTSGMDDPWGTTRAVRVLNSGGADQDVAQDLAVPGDFQYVLSVWARSVGGDGVSLVAETSGGSAVRLFALSAGWQRIQMRVGLGQSTESVRFGARVAAGKQVDLCGMQVEAQPSASAYQKTGARGGVHSAARFVDDVLTCRARSTDVFDASVRVTSRGN